MMPGCINSFTSSHRAQNTYVSFLFSNTVGEDNDHAIENQRSSSKLGGLGSETVRAGAAMAFNGGATSASCKKKSDVGPCDSNVGAVVDILRIFE